MYNETKDDNLSLAGSLLLAHPHLQDVNFARSVVLMTAHENAGSLGVVLNYSTGKRLGELSSEFKDSGLANVPVYVGGPVNREQIIIAAWKALPEEGQFKLYFGLEPVIAQSKMETDPDLEFRAFQGYSGWGEGQLVDELEDNAWVVADIDTEILTSYEGPELWKQLIMDVNPELGIISLEPESPESN